jgi:hypothetical protein
LETQVCKHCGHPIGYHWLEGERCSCKDCACPGYESDETERIGEMKAIAEIEARVARADPAAALAILRRAPDRPPLPGDERAAG